MELLNTLHWVQVGGEAFQHGLRLWGQTTGGDPVISHFDWALISALDQSAQPIRGQVPWIGAGGGAPPPTAVWYHIIWRHWWPRAGPGGIKAVSCLFAGLDRQGGVPGHQKWPLPPRPWWCRSGDSQLWTRWYGGRRAAAGETLLNWEICVALEWGRDHGYCSIIKSHER